MGLGRGWLWDLVEVVTGAVAGSQVGMGLESRPRRGAGCWTASGPQQDSRLGSCPEDKNIPGGREGLGASKAVTRRSSTPGVARGTERALPGAQTFGNCSSPAAPGPSRTRTVRLLLVINRSLTLAGWGPSSVGGASNDVIEGPPSFRPRF